MAGSTICAELSIVFIVAGMAGITILRRAFEDSIRMTGRALDICMTAIQRKGGVVMVKRHILPAA